MKETTTPPCLMLCFEEPTLSAVNGSERTDRAFAQFHHDGEAVSAASSTGTETHTFVAREPADLDDDGGSCLYGVCPRTDQKLQTPDLNSAMGTETFTKVARETRDTDKFSRTARAIPRNGASAL
ncbi:MAG: hypothetical protein QGG42_21425 [Phycisphaerae bacterium]|jgi:hypothetical protein|nr:hypothetical protein [Phycisphaerae bacterium]